MSDTITVNTSATTKERVLCSGCSAVCLCQSLDVNAADQILVKSEGIDDMDKVFGMRKCMRCGSQCTCKHIGGFPVELGRESLVFVETTQKTHKKHLHKHDSRSSVEIPRTLSDPYLVSSDPSLNTPHIDSSLSASGAETDHFERNSDMDVSVNNSSTLIRKTKIRSRVASSKARSSKMKRTVFSENGVKIEVTITKDIRDLEQKIESLKKEVESLSRKNDELDIETTRKDTGYQRLEREFEESVRETKKLMNDNSELRQDLEHKTEEEEARRTENLELRKELAKMSNKHLHERMEFENKEKELSDKNCRLEREMNKVKSEFHQSNEKILVVETDHKNSLNKLNAKFQQVKNVLEEKDLELERLNREFLREKNAHSNTKSALDMSTDEVADLEGRFTAMDLDFTDKLKERDGLISELKETNTKRAKAISVLENEGDRLKATKKKLESSIRETTLKQAKIEERNKSSKNSALKKMDTMKSNFEMQLGVFKNNEAKYHQLIDEFKKKLKAKDIDMDQRKKHFETEETRFKESRERLTTTIKKLEEVGSSHNEAYTKAKSANNKQTKKYNLLIGQFSVMRDGFKKQESAIQDLEAQVDELKAKSESEKKATSMAENKASAYRNELNNLKIELDSIREKFRKIEDLRSQDRIALGRLAALQKELQKVADERDAQTMKLKKLRLKLAQQSARLLKFEGCVQSVVKATDEVSNEPERPVYRHREEFGQSRSGNVKDSNMEDGAEGVLSDTPEDIRP